MLRLSGGGGGGKGGSGSSRPKEEPNSLRSRTRVKVLYLLSEGEIEGLGPELRKNVYFDNVPIQNADGTENFKDVAIDFRSGTNFQPVIDGFTDSASETTVGVRVTASGGPIVRTLTDANADALVIRLAVPALQVIDEEKGDVRGTSVRFRINLSVDGGIEYTVVDGEISGKTTGAYERSYRIPLYKPGTNYRISVSRITPDSTSTRVQDELLWQSFTSIINVPLTYPNSALLAIQLNGEQFRSIPRVGVKAKGIKCLIPDNYNPVTRTYTGTWSGSFAYAWTNNPAWILYNLLIRDRDGVGRYINTAQIDKWSFYAIGQYCDELVPDGFGRAEPRFVCNAYIQNDDEAYNVLNALASVFRGMIYWAQGQVFATQDAPWYAGSKTYGEENVIQEVDADGNVTRPCFNYEGASSKNRFTHVLVRYRDKDDFHKEKVEAVTWEQGIREYGYRETTIDAFGCDSRGQANRVGRWFLWTNFYETETLTFTIASDGMLSRPGEVINVIDPVRSGERRTGRIVAATANSITLDVKLSDLTLTGQPIITVVNPADGNAANFIVTGTSAQAGTGYAVLQVPLTLTPIVQTPWMLQSENLRPERWRVISVSEKSGQYTITATPYRADKFGVVEYGYELQPLPTTLIGDITVRPAAPSGLVVTEQIYDGRAAGARVRVNFGWQGSPSTSIVGYRAEWALVDGNNSWKIMSETPETFAVLDDITPGTYLFRVQAVNRLGLRSDYAEILQEVFGLTAPPADITNFTATPLGSQIQLQWDQSPDIDVLRGGEVIIKFTPKPSGATWLDGFEVARLQGATTAHVAALQAGTYMIRAVDSSGNQSSNPTFVSTGAIAALAMNTIASIAESPAFLGAKINTVVEGGILKLAPTTFFDAATGLFESQGGLFDSFGVGALFDSQSGLFESQAGLFDGNALPNVTSGSYQFASTIDVAAVSTCRVSATISAQVAASSSFFDSWADLFDTQIGLFDNTDSSQGDAKLQIRTAGANLTYGPWQDFVPGDYTARAFQFQLLMSTEAATVNLLVNELTARVDMPDLVESGSGTTGNYVVFPQPFRFLDVVVPQISSLQSGDYWQLFDVSTAGFRVAAFDRFDQPISRLFTWIARGY